LARKGQSAKTNTAHAEQADISAGPAA